MVGGRVNWPNGLATAKGNSQNSVNVYFYNEFFELCGISIIMTPQPKKSQIVEAVPKRCDLSFNHEVIAGLKDVTPCQIGKAVSELCAHFTSLNFQEVVLSPFTAYPIDYLEEVIDVPEIGQLRFNTEPEIWEHCGTVGKFFSTSTLFRKEKTLNLLRRSAFSIVDFYQPGNPESMLVIFKGILKKLADAGLLAKLHRLPFDHAQFDVASDGPILSSSEPRWVVATGYDAAHSFFEADKEGNSTRCELFLVTPIGFLEIAALGIVGWNRNPDYVFRCGPKKIPSPFTHLSGMGLGLERLLLAEQVLALSERVRKK
jgi:hypothetical protein